MTHAQPRNSGADSDGACARTTLLNAAAATTEGEAAFPERRVGFEAGRSGPSIDWLGVDYRGLGGWVEDC